MFNNKKARCLPKCWRQDTNMGCTLGRACFYDADVPFFPHVREWATRQVLGAECRKSKPVNRSISRAGSVELAERVHGGGRQCLSGSVNTPCLCGNFHV